MYLRNVPPEQEWQSLLTTILVPHLWVVTSLQFPWVDYVLPGQEEALQQKSGENKAGMGG